ncbi:MAG: nucleotide exchange factor GrpE, partial [Lactobacillus sp.]|nr:nucleotide exchange factor GrpE [Lactobacillus sp.]
KFDPNLHQAVQTVEAENEDQKDHVVRVLQKGYLYKDRTLRPAMVVVAQ